MFTVAKRKMTLTIILCLVQTWPAQLASSAGLVWIVLTLLSILLC